MTKRLIQHGNSLALVIDRAILDLVNIEADVPLKISTDDGRRLIISPVRDEKRVAEFRQSLAAVNRKHAKTLKRLAE